METRRVCYGDLRSLRARRFETFFLPLFRLTMAPPPIEQCGDENHANPKEQTNVPRGEGGGEGIARQASGKIAGREGRRPEERV